MKIRRKANSMGKVRWLCWMILLVGGVVGSAQQSNNALLSMKARLTAGTGRWALRIDGLHAVKSGLIPQTVVRIVNGKFQSMRSSESIRGADDIMLPAGAIIRVADLEVLKQPNFDVLRLKLTADIGGRAAVAILLPKGSLESMSESVLQSLVGVILQNQSDAAPDPRVLTRGEVPNPAPAQAQQWRIRPVQNDNQKGMTATLTGFAVAGSKTQPALFTVRCTKGTSPDAYPPFVASADVQVRPEMVTFETGHMEDKAAYHDNAGRSKLDNLPEIHIDINAESTDKLRVFGLTYDESDLKAVIQAAGSMLKVTILPEQPGKDTSLTAEFHLPAAAGGVQTMMSSCFEMLEAQEVKDRAKDVVSCPSVPGKVLKDMKILTESNGKELERDIDSDQVRNWNLPQATKTKPRPRLSMACFYGEPGYRTDPKDALEKRMFPIPASALRCGVEDATTENRNHGECTR